MTDEIGAELELILKNRERLNEKYFNYLIERAKKERYFRIGDIEFSFRKARYYYIDSKHYYDDPERIFNESDREVLSLYDLPEHSGIYYIEFDIKYNWEYTSELKTLILRKTNRNISIIVKGDKG